MNIKTSFLKFYNLSLMGCVSLRISIPISNSTVATSSAHTVTANVSLLVTPVVYPSSAIAQHVAQRCSCPVAVVDPAMTRLMEGSRCDMAVRGSAEQVLGEVAAEYLRGTT